MPCFRQGTPVHVCVVSYELSQLQNPNHVSAAVEVLLLLLFLGKQQLHVPRRNNGEVVLYGHSVARPFVNSRK
jgi:hypothetical protein